MTEKPGPPATDFDPEDFLRRLSGRKFFRDQTVHTERIAERPARHADVEDGLHPQIAAALEALGVLPLYTHQASAVDAVRAGRDVVIVTGTASGKTLCYNFPVVETLLEEPLATALYLFPTKALAQDQVRGLERLRRGAGEAPFVMGPYDGDTPSPARRKLRDKGNVVLTNPDMLHQGILPHHARWNRFFTHLRYVVIDEIHAYRGVFGSHLANVLRRLERICAHYGSRPRFVCCSATINNPREHAERVTGREMQLIDNDGSPRGARHFVMWNPPPIELPNQAEVDPAAGGMRRSPLWEAVHLMAALVSENIQTIAFVRTRLNAELIYKNTRDELRRRSRRLADAVHAYRGGYLPEERREIERRLAEREILGVASTNALELGIDIGSLDACILVGYPGAIASLWQQAGRAGRGRAPSVVFLVGRNSPMDQYLMTHCEYLFAQNPEQAVVDPDNPHIAVGHVKCAIQELPLREDETERFGPFTGVLLELLEEDRLAKRIDRQWFWASSDYPAADVSLRNISGAVYTIQGRSGGAERVIGTLDEISALSQLHDHAVYIHGAETYFVDALDIDQKIANVEKRDLDYYTQSVQSSQIRIDETEEDGEWRGDGRAGFGDVTVTTTIPMFKKIRFHSRDSLGFEKLELPPQLLETVAFWMAPPQRAVERVRREGLVVGEALVGVANVAVEVAPLFVMCDPQDIGTVVDAACLGRDALFVYDRYPGGMGYARRCLGRMDDLFAAVLNVIKECPCPDGCPSCVGAADPAFATSDLDSVVRDRLPDKRAARILLEMSLRDDT